MDANEEHAGASSQDIQVGVGPSYGNIAALQLPDKALSKAVREAREHYLPGVSIADWCDMLANRRHKRPSGIPYLRLAPETVSRIEKGKYDTYWNIPSRLRGITTTINLLASWFAEQKHGDVANSILVAAGLLPAYEIDGSLRQISVGSSNGLLVSQTYDELRQGLRDLTKLVVNAEITVERALMLQYTATTCRHLMECLIEAGTDVDLYLQSLSAIEHFTHNDQQIHQWKATEIRYQSISRPTGGDLNVYAFTPPATINAVHLTLHDKSEVIMVGWYTYSLNERRLRVDEDKETPVDSPFYLNADRRPARLVWSSRDPEEFATLKAFVLAVVDGLGAVPLNNWTKSASHNADQVHG